MCLRNKDGSRLVHSRCYKLSSGTRFFSFGAKDYERVLLLDLFHQKGDIEILLRYLVNGESKTLHNPADGHYEFPIPAKEKLRIEIRTKKAVGSQRWSIKKIDTTC